MSHSGVEQGKGGGKRRWRRNLLIMLGSLLLSVLTFIVIRKAFDPPELGGRAHYILAVLSCGWALLLGRLAFRKDMGTRREEVKVVGLAIASGVVAWIIFSALRLWMLSRMTLVMETLMVPAG